MELEQDSVFYYSGDPELKDPIGPFVTQNNLTCTGYTFSYLAKINAYKFNDNSNYQLTNFPTVVNGATTSGDYLLVSTKNLQNSPFLVNAVFTATLPYNLSII